MPDKENWDQHAIRHVGYLRRDSFGRVFIDECPTDEVHLTSPPPEGQERHTCRKYVDDILLVPEEHLGKRVEIIYELRIKTVKES